MGQLIIPRYYRDYVEPSIVDTVLRAPVAELDEMPVKVETLYFVEHLDRFGRLKGFTDGHNLVVTTGRNELLTRLVGAVPANVNWFVGLKDTGAVVAGDTMASHVGWLTITPYSNATDPAFTGGTVSGGSVDNSASKAVFNINAADAVFGAFMKDNSTKGGATGTLYGGGDFASSRNVEIGDTLNVTLTLNITST